jgi:protein tyrosine phosphatase
MKFVYANDYQMCFLVVLDNHSRVILSGDENTDYINASFIDVGGEELCCSHEDFSTILFDR